MNDTTHTYEAMFVLSTPGADFEAASEPIRTLLTRYEAEVLMLRCWDERKLAYDIHGHKRGLYALTFFKAPPSRVAEIEHDCQLDERFLRVLILRRDRLTAEEIEREKTSTVKPPSAPEPEARAAEGERRYGGRGRPRRPERVAEPTPAPAEETEPAEEESPNGEGDTNGEA